MSKTNNRLVCIVRKEAGKQDVLRRVPRFMAIEMMEKDPHWKFTSKNAYRKVALDNAKREAREIIDSRKKKK